MQSQNRFAASFRPDQKQPASLAPKRRCVDNRRGWKIGEGKDHQFRVQRLGHGLRRHLFAHNLPILLDAKIGAVRLDRKGDVLGDRSGDIGIAFKIAQRLKDTRVARAQHQTPAPGARDHFE